MILGNSSLNWSTDDAAIDFVVSIGQTFRKPQQKKLINSGISVLDWDISCQTHGEFSLFFYFTVTVNFLCFFHHFPTYYHSLKLQALSGTVFVGGFWGLNTFSYSIWSTRGYQTLITTNQPSFINYITSIAFIYQRTNLYVFWWLEHIYTHYHILTHITTYQHILAHINTHWHILTHINTH